MDTPMSAAPAASPKQQQQSQSQAAPQLRHTAKEGVPPELEGLLRGMQESQSAGAKYPGRWVRSFADDE